MMERIINIPSENWSSPPEFNPGIEHMIISDTLDVYNKKGVRTRFVRFIPGAATKGIFLHDYHEEVYLVSGDQILLDNETLKAKNKYTAGDYFFRPAGTHHGPFSSDSGCVLLEIHYY
jgi:uncharacterized RmlC-like cupin family protein